MASIYNTRNLVVEVEAVLNANTDIEKVSIGALEPLSSETAQTAVYISVENIALNPKRLNPTSSGYDRHVLINLYCNYDGTADALGIYDFVDSIERCLLLDNDLWTVIIDRDFVAMDFDNQENAPRRSVTMLFDMTYRLDCEIG